MRSYKFCMRHFVATQSFKLSIRQFLPLCGVISSACGILSLSGIQVSRSAFLQLCEAGSSAGGIFATFQNHFLIRQFGNYAFSMVLDSAFSMLSEVMFLIRNSTIFSIMHTYDFERGIFTAIQG